MDSLDWNKSKNKETTKSNKKGATKSNKKETREKAWMRRRSDE